MENQGKGYLNLPGKFQKGFTEEALIEIRLGRFSISQLEIVGEDKEDKLSLGYRSMREHGMF